MASIDENVEASFVFFISGLDVRRIISRHEVCLFFFYHLLVCGQRFDHSPAQCVLRSTEGTMWEGILFCLKQ